MKNKLLYLKPLYLLCLANVLIFIDFKLFYIFIIAISILFIFLEIKFDKLENFLITIIPINYYIYFFFSTFFENANSSIFWDMQNFLHFLRCNGGDFTYVYKFLNTALNCPTSIGYGPLSEIITLNIEAIWEITILISIIFTLLILFSLFITKKNKILLVIFLISPGFHFLFFSLNTDIFVLIYFILLFKSGEIENNLHFKFLILALISLIKTYTILIYFGYLLIFIVNRNLRSFITTCIYLLTTGFILFNHYIVSNSILPEPISYTRSFGLIHDIKIFLQIFGIKELIAYLVIVLISFLIFKNKIFEYFDLNIFLNTKNEKIYLILFPMCLGINLYQSWGYKFVFNSLLSYLIFSSVNKKTKVVILISNLVATTYYIIGWGYINTYSNFIWFSISKISFYLFFLVTLQIFITIFFNLINKRYTN